MFSPESGNREGLEGQNTPLDKEGQKGKFTVRFPDGTVSVFGSRREAAEALNQWREAA